MPTTLTPEAPADTMTAKQADELRQQLREAGWRPLESSTDFRKTPAGLEHVGATKTIAYFPAFRSQLGVPSGWVHDGEAAVPDRAGFVETYELVPGPKSAVWAPAA